MSKNMMALHQDAILMGSVTLMWDRKSSHLYTMCFTYNNDAVNAQTIIKQGDLIENEGWTDYMMKSNW